MHDKKNMNQKHLLRAVVRIHAYGKPVDIAKPFLIQDRIKAVGTGFIVPTPEFAPPNFFYILTCSHCVQIADTITIILPLFGMTEHPACVVSLCPNFDLALLALPAADLELSHLQLGHSNNLSLGQKLTAVGYPLGQTALKASDGVYAGFQERLQHTVSISPGNSGGPLMNENQEVIGINNSGVMQASNVGFAIPIEFYFLVQRALFTPPPHGNPSPERIIHPLVFGFEFCPITKHHAKAIGASVCLPQPSNSGVLITTILKQSAAASAGLQKGDILLKYDRFVIDNMGEVDVDWNYQKVRLQDVLNRVEPRPYPFLVWSEEKHCRTVEITPAPYSTGAGKMIYPPYDAVDYLIFCGLVITPLYMNYDTHPVIIETYACLTPDQLSESHVIVSHVFNGTVAQIEGSLLPGDRLSHINNLEVKTMQDVRHALTQLVITSVQKKVFIFRTHTGKMFLLENSDALAAEERAVSENLYAPDPQIFQLLRTSSIH